MKAWYKRADPPQNRGGDAHYMGGKLIFGLSGIWRGATPACVLVLSEGGGGQQIFKKPLPNVTLGVGGHNHMVTRTHGVVAPRQIPLSPKMSLPPLL